MKDRSSLRKANWSETREEWYLKECDKMLFDKKMELIIDDNDVYVKCDNHTKLIVQITKPKAMWYEIWFRLRDVYKIKE